MAPAAASKGADVSLPTAASYGVLQVGQEGAGVLTWSCCCCWLFPPFINNPAQVIRVSSNLGWSFELAIRPASDVALHDKYNITGFLQDNW